MRLFLAHFLFVMAAWTLVIKFLFPMAWAVSEGAPLLSFVWWDFWWVAHLWLGWALIRRPGYLFGLALVVAVVEIIIVVSKFVLFFAAPAWDMWTVNWLINKIFVLGVFTIMLVHMAMDADAYRPAVPDGDDRDAAAGSGPEGASDAVTATAGR